MRYYNPIAFNAYSWIELSCIIEIKQNTISNKPSSYISVISFISNENQLFLFNCVKFTMLSACKHTYVF